MQDLGRNREMGEFWKMKPGTFTSQWFYRRYPQKFIPEDRVGLPVSPQNQGVLQVILNLPPVLNNRLKIQQTSKKFYLQPILKVMMAIHTHLGHILPFWEHGEMMRLYLTGAASPSCMIVICNIFCRFPAENGVIRLMTILKRVIKLSLLTLCLNLQLQQLVTEIPGFNVAVN